MTEDEAVALAEARNRMPGAGRWFTQPLPDGSWRVVRVVSDTVAHAADGALDPSSVPLRSGPGPGLARREWGVL